MRLRITGSLLALMAGALLATPASASAAARYASPSGTPIDSCALADPCDIVTAVNNASAGDDVTIEPGSYTPTVTLDDSVDNLTIHGQAGAARPVITKSNTTTGMQLMGSGSSASYLEFDITSIAAGIIMTGQQSVDRMIVKLTNSANGEAACSVTGTMTNSVCSTAGTNGIAVFNVTGNAAATLRNDTLEATGGNSAGVFALATSPGDHPSIALVNSIAHGVGKDVQAVNSAGISATVTADHSNFATSGATNPGASVPAPGSGTNQTAAPQFANAASGDFHELATSPTVDAGVDSSANGSLDDDGSPRTMGAHTDIGAYEYPEPVCQAATATIPFNTASAVQLHCADPSGAPITSYAIATPPGHGTVSVNSTGAATYTPASGFSGSDTFTFDATSSHGTGAPATATVSVGAQPPPKLTGVKQSHKRWREGNKLARFANGTKPPVGTTFRFTVDEPVSVLFVFTQRGHKRGKLSFSAAAGAHKLRFQGRLSKHKRLKPGRYTLTIIATNSASRTTTARLKFRIVAP